MEAKARKRDVLVDATTRFAFYDERIPPDVYNGPLFEKWRREAERTNPHLLFMVKNDLMLHGAEEITAEQYPDAIETAGMKLPLEYKLAPAMRMMALM